MLFLKLNFVRHIIKLTGSLCFKSWRSYGCLISLLLWLDFYFKMRLSQLILTFQSQKPFALHKRIFQGYPLARICSLLLCKLWILLLRMQQGLDIRKVFPLPQCNTLQIISEYANNTSFTTRAKEVRVYNIIRIPCSFGIVFGLKINWNLAKPLFWIRC